MLTRLLALLTLGANPYLDEGQRLYDSMLYERAVRRLQLAVAVPTSSQLERRAAYDLLARAQLALGLAEEAERTYGKLLSSDPEAPAPAEASPKVRAAFQRAKERLYAPDFVRLRPLPAPSGAVALDVIDPWGLVSALVLFEAVGDSEFEQRSLDFEGAGASGRLTPPPVHTSVTRYYVEARSRNGVVLARYGSREDPNELRPAAPPGQSLPAAALPSATREPVVTGPAPWPAWVLGSVSVAALGLGVGLAFASAADARAADAAYWGSETRVLDARARERAVAANILIGGGLLGGAGTVVLVVAD